MQKVQENKAQDKPKKAKDRKPGTHYVSDLDLAERYGTHRTTVWRWAAKGILPAPVQITPGCTRWIAAEVDARDAEREAARGSAA